jgi:predicted DNA-binding protein
MAPERTEQVMVRLTPDLYEELRAESEREERTVAQTVRLLIRRHFEESSLAGA